MTRAGLLTGIVEIISDYRHGEISTVDAAHVDRWVRQFPRGSQLTMLAELHHVFGQTYFSKAYVMEWLEGLATSGEVTGGNSATFWGSAALLDIQENGVSQSEMVSLMKSVLRRKGIASGQGVPSRFVYVDDGLFSGSRIGNDLEQWITSAAPREAEVHVVVIAGHILGEFQTKKRLKECAEKAGKAIAMSFWASRWFENRKAFRDRSEILWPTAIPDDEDVAAYVAQDHKFPFEPRRAGGPLGVFSSEEGRQTLERELLIAGAHIRSRYVHPRPSIRPLGFSPFGLGFGTLVVTYRNCPNNAPLALWWGLDEEWTNESWYPLFARKTYD